MRSIQLTLHYSAINLPFKITLLTWFAPKLYGIAAIEGKGLVIKILAILPGVIVLNKDERPRVYAVLIVAAFIASSGVIFIFMQASESINGILRTRSNKDHRNLGF